MKKFFLRPLLACSLIAIALMSCSDDPDDVGPKITAPVGKIVAKVGGASFEATGGAQVYNNEIVLGGVRGTESLSIIITKAAAVGTYDVKGAQLGTTPDAEINYSPDFSNLFSSVFAANGETVGTVTITEIDETNKTISGTFSSKVLLNGAIKEIAEGSFNKLPYVTAPANTFTAKIDGQSFAASLAVAQNGLGEIVVNGQTLNGSKIIVLSFDEDIQPGTYPIGELGGDAPYGMYTVDLVNYVSVSGTLTITKHDTSINRVEGSFSFDVEHFFDEEEEGHSITEGSFAVTYN